MVAVQHNNLSAAFDGADDDMPAANALVEAVGVVADGSDEYTPPPTHNNPPTTPDAVAAAFLASKSPQIRDDPAGGHAWDDAPGSIPSIHGVSAVKRVASVQLRAEEHNLF